MSVEVMTAVFAAEVQPAGRKLVLLAMADYSDDSGVLWPSIRAIGCKASIGEAQARRHVRDLEGAGIVTVIGNAGGGYSKRDTRRYRLNLAAINALPRSDPKLETPSADATPCASATPCTDARTGVAPMHETPCTGATQTVIEPSENHHSGGAVAPSPAGSRSSRKSATADDDRLRTFPEWLSWVKCKGEKPLAADDVIHDYAAKAGITNEMMFVQWQHMKEVYATEPAKRAKRNIDWRAVYRNSVRQNWWRLWEVTGDGAVQWTSRGLQARNVHDRHETLAVPASEPATA